ncbi:MAG: lipid A biosynthesis acyltransferase [Flavipsychrobacter sp.]
MSDNPKWDGKSRGSTLGYKIFVWLLRVGGLAPAYALLHFVTLYYLFFVPKATKPLIYLYQERLGYSKSKAKKLLRKNLLFFGQTLIDKIVVLAGLPNKLSFEHTGVEHIEEMVAAGKGGILVSAHLGNWEVAGHLLKRVNTTINILMYDGEGEQVKAYMEQFDGNKSFNIIYLKEDNSHIYEITAALNRNELICLHADRYRPGNRTITHEFLGKEAQFPIGPFTLGAKLKAPVCFVFAFKETNFHYHFYAFPSTIYEGRGMEGINNMLKAYIALMEKYIKKYPAQWFNYFDFWN